MSKECVICGKKPMTGHTVSHAHNLTKRRWLPNLQKIRIETKEGIRKSWVCARCIKGGKASKIL